MTNKGKKSFEKTPNTFLLIVIINAEKFLKKIVKTKEKLV